MVSWHTLITLLQFYLIANMLINLTVLEISLRQNTFQASEIDGEMDVSVCKDKPISSSVTVTISAVTVDTANISVSEGVVIPPIDVNLPNRAGNY